MGDLCEIKQTRARTHTHNNNDDNYGYEYLYTNTHVPDNNNDYDNYVININASEERGVQTIRDKIEPFCKLL